MSKFRANVTGGLWLITTRFGATYEVRVTEFSDHEGMSFSGRYRYDLKGDGVMHDIGIGTFPFKEIRKMSRIGD